MCETSPLTNRITRHVIIVQSFVFCFSDVRRKGEGFEPCNNISFQAVLTVLNYIGTEVSKVICYIAVMTYVLNECTTYM